MVLAQQIVYTLKKMGSSLPYESLSLSDQFHHISCERIMAGHLDLMILTKIEYILESLDQICNKKRASTEHHYHVFNDKNRMNTFSLIGA